MLFQMKLKNQKLNKMNTIYALKRVRTMREILYTKPIQKRRLGSL